MTLQECYAAMGGNYEEVLGRLRSERLIRKFVLKFLEDESYNLLCTSLEAGNYEDAFRGAHTIKGVCQNLSMTKLQTSSTALADALRGGVWKDEAAELVERVKADYQETTAAIRAFQEANAE